MQHQHNIQDFNHIYCNFSEMQNIHLLEEVKLLAHVRCTALNITATGLREQSLATNRSQPGCETCESVDIVGDALSMGATIIRVQILVDIEY